MDFSRGFQLGVRAMRDATIARFEVASFGQWAGWQAAQVVRDLVVRETR